MSTEVAQDARKFVKALYEATDGKSLQWRMKQAAVDYAVEKGWLLVKDRCSVCLTEEGAALLR